MTADLQAAGWAVNRKRIARLMRSAGLRARGRCRRRGTTDSQHAWPIAPNRVAQHCTAAAPNQLWVTDITSVATEEGWLYVALVMDLFSRKFVGWAWAAYVDCRLTLAALRMALGMRQPDHTLIHHSDRGSQGGFKWSLQHLDGGGCDEHSQAPFGSVWAAALAVTRSTVGGRTR